MSYKPLDSFTPILPPLVDDYLKGESKLEGFYSYSPSMEGLIKAAQNRQFPQENRSILCDVLKEQMESSQFPNEGILKNIDRLRSDNVFTVTTGHQVCLLGGPLFFFYKILSVIKLSEQLYEKGVEAVPVYWMATEDHDFDEINHVFIGDKKFDWETDQQGCVGRMKLDGITSMLDRVFSNFSADHRYTETLNRLRSIYQEGKALGSATRDLVQWVFGDLGVIVIDADDARLKRVFDPQLKSELQQQFSSKALIEASSKLSVLGFENQVAGREINLFYLLDGYRERLVNTKEGFATADNNHQFSESEILKELDMNPERFSPNVVLRPLYQEVILPNIAYVGGPGETSYWLQLKAIFDEAHVQIPVVLLRDMFFISNSMVEKKRAQLGVKHSDLLTEKYELLNELIRKQGSHEHVVESHQSEIEIELNRMVADVESFEPSLVQSAETEKTRILNRLEVLKKKMLRADRKKNQIIEQRIDAIKSVLEPLGSPQERIHNWLNYFGDPKQGHDFLDLCAPLEQKITVVQDS